MEPTIFSLWLVETFAAFDHAVLGAVHTLQQSPAGVVLDPLARLLGALGAGGVGLILLGLVLLALRPTRRVGLAVLLALALGALVTNVLLKPLVSRPRPYADAADILHQWWLEAGAATESDASFPSGHTTATAAAMAGIFFSLRSRRRWLVWLAVAAMGWSRLALVVHYPTDVAAGALIGLAAGSAAAALARRISRGRDWFDPSVSH